jgi:hypothetical protein
VEERKNEFTVFKRCLSIACKACPHHSPLLTFELSLTQSYLQSRNTTLSSHHREMSKPWGILNVGTRCSKPVHDFSGASSGWALAPGMALAKTVTVGAASLGVSSMGEVAKQWGISGGLAKMAVAGFGASKGSQRKGFYRG